MSSGIAITARANCLRILCDQLEHSQHNLEQVQEEIERLLSRDPKVKGLLAITEFGPMTVAVLRAELGEVNRFARMDPRGGLCRTGFAGQTKRQMERADQALQARQWAIASDLVFGRFAQYSLACLALWAVLPSPGGPWYEKGHGSGGRHAQALDCLDPSAANPTGL